MWAVRIFPRLDTVVPFLSKALEPVAAPCALAAVLRDMRGAASYAASATPGEIDCLGKGSAGY